MNQIVINGDNINVLKNYPDNYFDAVVTDPPYGLGKEPDAVELMKDWVEHGYHEITGSGFMGKEWDAFIPQPIFWKEVFRVLKHGGHVVSFFGTRTYDWGVMSMRFAGFEVRDCIQWLYGSGFPKSHNISKAIDKLHGAEREVIGEKVRGDVQKAKENGSGYLSDPANRNNEKQFGYGIEVITKATTDEAKQWEGWGSALKPANEPIVLARKPLEKGLSIAENVLKWGTGGINIDASRIGFKDDADYKESTQKNQHADFGTKPMTNNNVYGDYSMVQPKNYEPTGRFPANLILTHHPECECKGLKKVKGMIDKPTNRTEKGNTWDDDNSGLRKNMPKNSGGFGDENGEETIEDWSCHPDCPIKIMDDQSGVTKSQRSQRGNIIDNNVYGKYKEQEDTTRGHNDKGSASRFFYCAKASKSERNKGLEGFEEKGKPDNYIMPKLTCSQCGSKRVDSSNKLVCGCNGKTHYEEQNSLESKNNLAGGNKNFHPTVKPVKLMQYLARLITPPNGKVLDPFCGSGTTGIACKLEGFEFVGIEQDPEYTKIAQARITNWKDGKEVIEDKKTAENNQSQQSITQTTLF